MIDEKELNQWWHSLSIKRQDSYKRLINNSTVITMSESDIKWSQFLYEEEIRDAFREFWEHHADSNNNIDPSGLECFRAGFNVVINNRDKW